MPDQPTKEQFEEAARRVMASAPSGLSREQFFKLIEGELQPKQTMSLLEMSHRGVADSVKAQEKEPDTWWGGFGKSLSDQITGSIAKNPLVQGAAQPESMGDILSLLIPNGIEGAMRGAKGMGTRLIDAIKESPRARDIPKTLIRNSLEAQRTGVPAPIRSKMRPMEAAQSEIRDSLGGGTPLAEQIDSFPDTPAPERMRSGDAPYRPEETPFHERPLYEQVDSLPETEAPITTRGGDPPVTPSRPTPETGRLTGRKSPTLEDALLEGLQESRGVEDPHLSSLAPEADVTGGGSFRQSGKFKRSESLGQAGGYSSGKPGITDTNYDELIDKFGGRGEDDALLGGSTSPLEDAASPLSTAEAPDAYRSIEDPEWHSGEKATTPEGQEASYLHRRENEMGMDYKRRLNDPLASFLLTGLMGHTAKDLWDEDR